jgi:hypothetical protein
MTMNYITITRAGYKLGEYRQDIMPGYSRRTRRIITDEGQARVISPSLALYKYDKGTQWSESRYHVIHIPTGLVIADITYDMVKDIKETFENTRWTFKDGDYTTLHMIPKHKSSFREFSITCRIRYEVERTNTNA